MAIHSSVLAWRIPGTGEPGGLPSMGSHRVRHDWSDLAAAAAAWKCRFKYKPMQKGENLLPMSQETSIQYFLFVRPLTYPASCVAQGVCSSGRRERGLRRGTVPPSWPLSSPPLSPLFTLSCSPKKMLLFLLMLQQRCPSCSFRANTWAPHLGSSVLCTDRYATASDCNGEGPGPKADWCGIS